MTETLTSDDLALLRESCDPQYQRLPMPERDLVRRLLDDRDGPDVFDGAAVEYRECMEVRRLLGYLWNATGKNHLRPVHDLFAEDDPIVADVERLAIFDGASDD